VIETAWRAPRKRKDRTSMRRPPANQKIYCKCPARKLDPQLRTRTNRHSHCRGCVLMAQDCPDPAARHRSAYWGRPAVHSRAMEVVGAAESDPGCVKTLLGITAPGILSPTIVRRAKKRKNSSSARHYDQIRFRFRTAKTPSGLRLGAACAIVSRYNRL
jgi:Pyruvate/2-oxoacid:ferredoxin oxidoreductase delta subunit